MLNLTFIFLRSIMFAFNFIKKPLQIGALCASSSQLACAMSENVDIEKARFIAEIGAGTGALTKQILRKKSKNAHFFAVEIDEKMSEILRIKYPNLDIKNDKAQNLSSILQNKNIAGLDLIISSIPWTFLKSKEQDELLETIYKNLNQNGYFTTFAYVFATSPKKRKQFKNKLFELFAEVQSSKIIWRNIPPAFIFRCRK